MSVKLISDSACDLTQSEANELDVTILPLKIRIDGAEYLDGVTITQDEFYKKVASSKRFPVTRPVTPAQFTDALKPMLEAGDDVVIITISEKFSNTAKNAAIAAYRLGGNVWIVDSGSATIGQNILLRYAIRLRDRGVSARQIVGELERAKVHIRLLVKVDTLKYLMLGGHISRPAVLAGTLMRLKPVLKVANGEVELLGKARGTQQINEILTKSIQKVGDIDFSMPAMVAYSGEPTVLKEYLDSSKALWEGKEDSLLTTRIGSTICTHAGLGTVAVAFFSNEYRLYHW